MSECTVCGGELEYIGTLGWMDHYRCRRCGATSSIPIEKREPEGEDDPCGDRDCDECEIGGCPYHEVRLEG